MTDTMSPPESTSTDESLLRKIRGLLDKAESTEFEAEQEALFGKAAELMARYRITEAMLDLTRPAADRGKIVTRTFILGAGPYVQARLFLIECVGNANGCKTLTRVHWDGREAIITGFEADVTTTEVIYTSLLIQATSAMKREAVPVGENTTSFRRSFLFGFAGIVGRRLREANEEAVAGVGDKDAQSSTALVLVDRKKLVEEELFKRYGKLRTERASRSTSGSGSSVGHQAGGRADLGGRRVGGGRNMIGSGR